MLRRLVRFVVPRHNAASLSGSEFRLPNSEFLMSPLAKRRLLLVAKLAIMALAVWFVGRALMKSWADLEGRFDWAKLNWALLLFAAALYPIGQLPFGWFWRRVLRGLGYELPLSKVLRAYYVGLLGRYIPGKAMVIVIRGGLLARYGVRPATAAVSVFYETLTMMAVGSAVGVVMLLWKFPERQTWLATAIVTMLVTGVPTIPAVREFLIKKLRRGKLDSESSHDVKRPGFASLLMCWGVVAVGWFLMGTSIAVTMQAAGFAASASWWDQWAVGTAAAALSVVLGFLSFIPVGLGVREAVLITVLSGMYGETAAPVGAVLVRLVWLLSEVVVSVILYFWGPKPLPIAAPGSDSNETASAPP